MPLQRGASGSDVVWYGSLYGISRVADVLDAAFGGMWAALERAEASEVGRFLAYFMGSSAPRRAIGRQLLHAAQSLSWCYLVALGEAIHVTM